ncbi:MAG TPA: hypothetical protein VF618_26175 [Thermoanaerobaculia bacterium]
MKHAALDAQLRADYLAITEKFGALDFEEFIVLWHEADALMQATVNLGLEPSDAGNLLLQE